jgi:NDP-sugar pyrophosphorylase family protein
LDFIPEGYSDFAKDIFPEVLKKGDMYGFRAPCYFKEVGQMERFLIAKKDIESGDVALEA